MYPSHFRSFVCSCSGLRSLVSSTASRSLRTMVLTSTLLAAMPVAEAPATTISKPYISNPVKEALARNELTYAFTVKLLRSIEVVQLAHTAGFNSILVDLEHAPMTLEQTGQICLAALARGMCPIVRVPQLERHWISRTLDIGALGILVPHVSVLYCATRRSIRQHADHNFGALSSPCPLCNPNRSRLSKRYAGSWPTRVSNRWESDPPSPVCRTLDTEAIQ